MEMESRCSERSCVRCTQNPAAGVEEDLRFIRSMPQIASHYSHVFLLITLWMGEVGQSLYPLPLLHSYCYLNDIQYLLFILP